MLTRRPENDILGCHDVAGVAQIRDSYKGQLASLGRRKRILKKAKKGKRTIKRFDDVMVLVPDTRGHDSVRAPTALRRKSRFDSQTGHCIATSQVLIIGIPAGARRWRWATYVPCTIGNYWYGRNRQLIGSW